MRSAQLHTNWYNIQRRNGIAQLDRALARTKRNLDSKDQQEAILLKLAPLRTWEILRLGGLDNKYRAGKRNPSCNLFRGILIEVNYLASKDRIPLSRIPSNPLFHDTEWLIT